MRWVSLVLAVAATTLLSPVDSSAGKVSLVLTVANRTVLLGEPVGVTMTLANGSGTSLKLPFVPGGDVLGPWSDVPSVLVGSPGRAPRYGLLKGRQVTANFAWRMAEDGAIQAPPGGSITVYATLELPPPLATTPGQYNVYASYVAQGKALAQEQLEGRPPSYTCVDCWKGEVSSSVTAITLSAPEGVDSEAYDRFGGQPMRAPELLRDFPTSTYAAYVIRDFTSRGLSGSANDAIVDEFKDGAAGVLRDIPCPPSVSPCVQHDTLETRGVKALDWTAEWIDLVLKTHPDIWFADEMRLRLALDEFIAGKSALGASDLENLAKNAQPYVAEKAGQILALLKQKGIVM
jgi:hypothetical protein